MTVGGAEVLADRLARQFSDRYEMVFLCLDLIGELGGNLQRDGYRIQCVSRQTGIDVRCIFRLARSFRDQRIDLVVAHQYTPFFYALASRRCGANRPIVFVEHGRFHPDFPRRKRILFNRLMLRKRDRVVAVGTDVRRALIENEGLPGDRVQVIHNGVNLTPFADAHLKRDEVRGTLGIAPAAFLITQVARLDYLKDHLTAVRAMQLLVKDVPNAVLLLVGEGDEREKIEEEVERCDLRQHVRLLGSRNDIPSLLGASDAMLLTSISEGIPLTLIEGMAASLPIVATNVGGVGEVAVHDLTALLAASADCRQISEHLGRLASDPALRDRLGAAGKHRAAECFSEGIMHRQYAELFEQALAYSCKSIRSSS